MIILCCPVEGRLWPATAASLAGHAPGAEIIPVPAEDISRPWRDIAARWGQDDLLYIEQDVILHDGVIPQFEACPEPWCLFPHPHHSHPDGELHATGMGCNRFRREFMQAVPVEAVEAQAGSCSRCEGRNPRCWAHLDGRTREAGEAAGFRLHVHWPPVGHRDVTAAQAAAFTIKPTGEGLGEQPVAV